MSTSIDVNGIFQVIFYALTFTVKAVSPCSSIQIKITPWCIMTICSTCVMCYTIISEGEDAWLASISVFTCYNEENIRVILLAKNL